MNRNAKTRIRDKNAKKTDLLEDRRPLNIKEYRVYKQTLLLEFLVETLVGQSRNNIKTILKRHCVSVDGAPVSQFNFELTKGDIVIVSKIPIKAQKGHSKKLPIIYEDDELIVIDKPCGVLSIASDKEKANTAYRMVTDYLQAFDKHNRVYVVHRIDKETSGVLMFAKNEVLRNAFQEKWNDLVVKRGYYAVVEGYFKETSGTITSYLKMNHENLMYVTDRPNEGQLCVTHFEVIKQNEDFSLLDVKIDSGRKNQIRVQLGSIDHFVVGDDKYGNPKDPLHRLGLHAYQLTIKHPFTGKVLNFESKMPGSFMSLIK
ncbi:MAG: RluA family pseudouridine synthase [Bacilli bacterium]